MAFKTYRPYAHEQLYLMPPALQDWLSEGHLAYFVSEVVDQLDLSAITRGYEAGDGRGQPPYHPAMMVKLLLYAYGMGKPSSRWIERATYEEVAYRVLAANQHPDHASLAACRRRHLSALAGLFGHVLRVCQRAGLVTMGHVVLEGTKVKAHASKHTAMSSVRMGEAERKLEHEVARALPGQAWQSVTWREGTAGSLRSHFARVRVRAAHRDMPRDEEWLIIEWAEGTEEPAHDWFSNLSTHMTWPEMVDTVMSRWRIERDDEELKQELGLGHYEGRTWRGFHHHASLCIAAYGFLQLERLSGSKKNAARFQAPALPEGFQPRGAGAHAAS